MFPVYEPAEDSELLGTFVKRYARGRVLDMGTGSGYLGSLALKCKRVHAVTFVDKNPAALAAAKKAYAKITNHGHNVSFVLSDLCTALNPACRFDTIIFNPPYLPDDGYPADPALIGGKHGYETIVRFLETAPQFLTPTGTILLLVSSLSGLPRIREELERQSLTVLSETKTAFDFEQLYVWRLKKSTLRQNIERAGVEQLRFAAKGKRGLVYQGIWKGKSCAVKVVNPLSAASETLAKEGKMLRRLQKTTFAPMLYAVRSHCIVMEWIEGDRLLSALQKRSSTQQKDVLRGFLDICLDLDRRGIIKEELHRPWKHIIVENDGVVRLIDYERAHTGENIHKNVTQFLQFLRSLQFHFPRLPITFDSKSIDIIAKKYAISKESNDIKKVLK